MRSLRREEKGGRREGLEGKRFDVSRKNVSATLVHCRFS